MGELGKKFRKAREAKELSFDDVSNVIKISPRMLKAIEEEQYEQLPGGVFNKGFIRAYAKHLGLDPEESVNEYLAFVREEQLKAQQAWQAERPVEVRPSVAAKAGGLNRKKSPESSVKVEELPGLHLPRAEDVRPARKEFLGRPSSDFPWRIVAAGAVAAALGILLWIRHSRVSQTPAAKSNPAAVSAPAPAPASAPIVPAQVSASNSQPLHPAAVITSTSTAPAPRTAVQPAGQSSDVTVHGLGKPLPKTTDQSASALNLIVRATEDSWISVRADGQSVASETLIAPAASTFHASREIVVKVGNAGGVNFVFGGKEIPPQGAEGDVKTIVFDAQGMRILPPTPAGIRDPSQDQPQTQNQ
jgi:cytoskeleton protein RodZ